MDDKKKIGRPKGSTGRHARHEWRGRLASVAQVADETGIDRDRLHKHIRSGRSLEQAVARIRELDEKRLPEPTVEQRLSKAVTVLRQIDTRLRDVEERQRQILERLDILGGHLYP